MSPQNPPLIQSNLTPLLPLSRLPLALTSPYPTEPPYTYQQFDAAPGFYRCPRLKWPQTRRRVHGAHGKAATSPPPLLPPLLRLSGEAMGSAAGGEQPPTTRLLSIPKEGERILAPTRRPDGTFRKPIRIRAGYVPQDEVAIYQSKGALLRKGLQPDVPPGYDPALDAKPKTKSAKRNERKKEKRHQAALVSSTEKGKNLDSEQAEMIKSEEVQCAELMPQRLESVEAVTDQMGRISVSATSVVVSPSTDLKEGPRPESSGPDIDKKIRALKKKIRLAEAQLQGNQQNMTPEQLEKMAKLEGWREELKLLEDRKANL